MNEYRKRIICRFTEIRIRIEDGDLAETMRKEEVERSKKRRVTGNSLGIILLDKKENRKRDDVDRRLDGEEDNIYYNI